MGATPLILAVQHGQTSARCLELSVRHADGRMEGVGFGGCGLNLKHSKTAGFSPWFHLLRFHFGYLVFTHSLVFLRATHSGTNRRTSAAVSESSLKHRIHPEQTQYTSEFSTHNSTSILVLSKLTHRGPQVLTVVSIYQSSPFRVPFFDPHKNKHHTRFGFW